MTISIWRYSHLTLAISSSIFILLATLTGIILAFEPILNKLEPYAVKNAQTLSVAKTIDNLKANYDEIISINIDRNSFVQASVITKQGKNQTFYINPFTGKKIGNVIEKAPIFKFATNLHRSLFLKSTGRFIVGLVSFLLFLMVVTGIILIVKRQGGILNFFKKVIKEDFQQYFHVVIGKYALIPLIIITLSGVYLSLEKFSLLPLNKNKHVLTETHTDKPTQTLNFDVFKSTTLKDIKHIEFPFSTDAEDYFIIKLKDKELYVNQYSGNTVSKKKESLVALASSWSMVLHTGQGSILWSLVLLVTCFAILFFIYSGFAITLNRKKHSIKINNKFSKDNAEYIILVGSESGSTFGFAKTFYNALIQQGKSVFVSELNNYSNYKKAKHLVVFTSTYGDGEAPINATNFEKLITKTPQQNTLQYTVLGFGSLAYKAYCKYAVLVDALLQKHQNFTPNLALHKINNQSFKAFKNWAELWSASKNLKLKIDTPTKIPQPKNSQLFKVVNKSKINTDHSFLIEFKPEKKIKFTSGDLLSILPQNDPVERLYSIAKVNNNILLSIKKHEFGKCSNYLNTLKLNDIMTASIKKNKDFYLPKKAKEVVMIANGTGIAPFLGMINNKNHNNTKNYLFWGGRTKESYQTYSKYIDKAFYNKSLNGIFISFSKEESEKKYVQNTLEEKEDLISRVLKNKGVIMICGSVAMEKGVLKTLNTISESKLNTPLNMSLIKTDCY
ncbi:hypothetical protein GCM10022291_11450 [Postechiella marina]|uniref:Methionine synthase reductase n=1 Tax=Postechiella marina TaxID=943941 RepID=A0ABP8C4Z6_9FLAO